MSGDIIVYFCRNYDLHTHINTNTFLYKEKYLYIAPIIPSFTDNMRAHTLVKRKMCKFINIDSKKSHIP